MSLFYETCTPLALLVRAFGLPVGAIALVAIALDPAAIRAIAMIPCAFLALAWTALCVKYYLG